VAKDHGAVDETHSCLSLEDAGIKL